MIRATGLVKSFGQHRVLHGESFVVPAGKITLLIGPNGAGKTTTMRLVAGLARPDAGNVEIGGVSAQNDGRHYRSLISFLPQSPDFHPQFTCRQILKFYACLRGVPLSRVGRVIALAGLEEVADKPSRHLSGGMRQRLGLALLLLPEAPVLLLDEPGLSLDPEWRDRLQSILREEGGRGRAILVTTHLLGEWNGKADVCLLCEGGVIQGGVDPDALEFAARGGGDGVQPPTPVSPPDKSREPSVPVPGPSPVPVGRAVRAVLLREIHAALLNRYLQIFTLLALGGGLASVWLSENLEAIAHITLQVCLYGVPLFAILLGVSSARMESEEWPMLFSQPVRRSSIFLGKFFSGWGVFLLLLALLFAPGLFVGAPADATILRWFESAGLSAVFIALGLCVGVWTGDRARALISGLVAWLSLLFVFDLAALALAGWSLLRKLPELWIALLMINPLDAFRIQALFQLEQIPPETAARTPLAAWWLNHASACFFVVAAIWTLALLAVTLHKIRRIDV